MSSLRIAEVAARTGVPATTLRYYEEIGLVIPAARRENGYRAYSERDVERVSFLTRAKQLDLSLAELRELLEAWDADDCAGVQDRMAQVVAGRLQQTQARVVDLLELAAQLQTAIARLASSPPREDGGCDDGCACATATATATATAALTGPRSLGMSARPTETAVPLTADPGSSIACTLDPRSLLDRTREWQAVLCGAVSREPVADGCVLMFPHDVALTGEIARLAAAEQVCCSFFAFTLAVDAGGVRLEVRAPEDGQHVLSALFGPTETARPAQTRSDS